MILRSAAYRIAILSSAAFAAATILLGAIVYLAAHHALVRQLDDRVTGEATALAATYRTDGLAELRDEIAERERSGSANALGYALFADDGRRLAGSLRVAMPAPGLQDVIVADPREGPDPARAMTLALPGALPGGLRLVVATDRTPIERIDATVVSLFAAAFVAVLLIGTAGALLFGAYLRGRLSGMSGTAEAIMRGDLSRRMTIGAREDEFDRLGQVLNAMLDRIAALLDNIRQVSGDVAHDLRTPLTRLRTGLEVALGAGDVEDARGVAIGQAIDHADAVLALFAAILDLAEIEAGGAAVRREPLDLSALVEEIAESYAAVAEDEGRAFFRAIAPGIAIAGNRTLIAQLLVNLLDNALRHTPPGTAITVRLRGRDGAVLLTIADAGAGIPAEDRPRAIERFTRLEGSRSTPGHGLGLSLAAAIAKAHGATVALEDNRPGLSVTVRFSGMVP